MKKCWSGGHKEDRMNISGREKEAKTTPNLNEEFGRLFCKKSASWNVLIEIRPRFLPFRTSGSAQRPRRTKRPPCFILDRIISHFLRREQSSRNEWVIDVERRGFLTTRARDQFRFLGIGRPPNIVNTLQCLISAFKGHKINKFVFIPLGYCLFFSWYLFHERCVRYKRQLCKRSETYIVKLNDILQPHTSMKRHSSHSWHVNRSNIYLFTCHVSSVTVVVRWLVVYVI